MKDTRHYILDFDSTFISVEALEELADIALKGKKDKENILEKIKELTDKGIEGEISFTDGLRSRLELIHAKKKDIDELVRRLKNKITPSIKRNKDFFKEHAGQVLVISAGFREFIVPIVKEFGIPEKSVYANEFRFDKENKIIGFDDQNLLSQTDGKKEQLKALKLKGEVFVIGDGFSDFLMKYSGDNVRFFAFTENIERKSAKENADHVAPCFDEFLFHNKLPMSISYPKSRIKVLLLESIHPNAVKAFSEEGYQVELMSHALPEDELCKAIEGVSILGIRSKTKLTKKVIEHADRLIAVGAFCIGTNQIDLEACLERGIAAFNAPYSNTRSVVELVIGEIIMLMRGIMPRNEKMHRGIWDKSATGSYEIRGKTLGIVGYGNIGSQLSVLAESLGMKVVFYDRVDKLALGNAQRCDSLKALLKLSDVVTLHVDGDPANRNFFGEKEFRMMKEGSILLNLSRGFVVDIDALCKNLDSGRIKGAAVDVFPKEPGSNADPFESKLVGYQNVILSPHVGGSTQEAQEHIALFVPDKLIQYVNTGDTFSSVNFPNLRLPSQQNAHRLIHIHYNQTGVLAQINQVLSDHNCNIVGQYLKTNEGIGYVITDIDKKYDKKVTKELREINGTIKFRVLY